jgi:hypothetical protein
MGHRCDLSRLASGHVDRRSVVRDLVSPPEHLNEAVQVLGTRDALQPCVCSMLAVPTYLRFHLADRLLQRHGRSDLQEAQLGLQLDELRLRGHHVELPRGHFSVPLARTVSWFPSAPARPLGSHPFQTRWWCRQ